jgi:hypothetical protein
MLPIVLYGYETYFENLREQNTEEVIKPKRYKATEIWKELHS